MGTTASLPMYTIEDVAGKGKGLIATEDIAKGTRILSEKPIIIVGQRIANMEQLHLRLHQQLSSLSEATKQEFFSLKNAYPYTNSTDRSRGILQTNALPIGPDLDAMGVFLEACRINHACDSNATNFWDENIKSLTIHAVKDIRKGEEITIFYLHNTRNRRVRQEELREKFKFTCSCALCSLPPDQSRASDQKLDQIYTYDWVIERGGVPGLVVSPRRLLGYVDEQVRLWNAPTPHVVGLGRAYPDALQIAVANGDLARARIFAERVVPLYVITLGDDSPDVAQYRRLAVDPTAHEYYGLSMAWKTNVDEVPQGLGSEEFEDWLWKR